MMMMMFQQQQLLGTAVVLVALVATFTTTHLPSCDAYVVMRPLSQHPSTLAPQKTSSSLAFTPRTANSNTVLFSEPAGDNNNNSDGEKQRQEVKAEEQEQEDEDPVTSEEEEAAEEEEEEEDPEVTALKEAIADLEGTYKEKQSTIQYLKDQADQYSKGGYARKVAEMETMRRSRSSTASSNKDASIANVLRDFLPVMDKLDMLKEKYQNDDFGKQYVALAGNMKGAFSQMGVTEYEVSAGEPIDRSRVLAVEEVHTPDHPRDTIIEPLKPGMELKGNIIRFAECVVSLGEVTAEEEEEEGDEAAPEESGEESADEEQD